MKFGMPEFSSYLNSILTGEFNQLGLVYTGYGAIVLGVVMLSVYAVTSKKAERKELSTIGIESDESDLGYEYEK